MTQSDRTRAIAASQKALPMGHHAAGGAAWAVMQSGSSKILGFAAQFVTAYVLDKQSLGAALQALAIMAFPTVFQRFGMTELLVQKQRRFDKLASAGHWISVASGLLVTAISAVFALAVGIYKSKHLVPGNPEDPWLVSKLVLACALGNSLDGFIALPQAKLRIQLQFRKLNFIALYFNLLTASLTIVFLLAGFGPMSIILPRTIAKLYELIATWNAAGVKVKMHADFSRWKYLLPSGAILTSLLLCSSLIQNADNVAVSIFQGQAALGIYGFAFNLSTQSIQLLAVNMTATLFSVFAKLSAEPQRQAEAFLRSAQALNLIVIPFCILQAAVVRPLLHFLYGPKWDAAAPVLQALSIGMSFLAVAGGTAALFQAQGRFKAQLGYQFATGIAFALLMVVTAIIGNEFAVGVAVCVFYAIAFPFGAYLATQPMRIGVKRILDLFMRPLLGSIVACCVPLLAIQLGESLPLQAPKAILLPARIVDLIQCIVISVAAFSVYILLMARFQTESSMAVMGYVRAFANRVRNIPGAGRTFRYFGLIDI